MQRDKEIARNLLLFFTFFFGFLSLFLFYRLQDAQTNLARQEDDAKFQSADNEFSAFWMRRLSDFGIVHLKDESGKEIDINALENAILIVFSDRVSEGCKECLGLEVTDWQRAMLSVSHPVEHIVIVGRAKSKMKLKQALGAMGYTGHLVFDDAGEAYQKLNLNWSPAVFFLRRGYVVFGYIGDMNDREKTIRMIGCYIRFLEIQ